MVKDHFLASANVASQIKLTNTQPILQAAILQAICFWKTNLWLTLFIQAGNWRWFHRTLSSSIRKPKIPQVRSDWRFSEPSVSTIHSTIWRALNDPKRQPLWRHTLLEEKKFGGALQLWRFYNQEIALQARWYRFEMQTDGKNDMFNHRRSFSHRHRYLLFQAIDIWLPPQTSIGQFYFKPRSYPLT